MVVLAVLTVTISAGAMVKLKMFPAAAGAFLALCVLVDGLWEGEIYVGIFAAMRKIARKRSPWMFWSVVTLYLAVVVLLILLAFAGGTRVSAMG